MATAHAAAPWQGALSTTTVRQFTRAAAVALAAVAVGAIVYIVEKYALRLERRFIENPADVMMRALALAHFLVGWLFLFTSPRLRNRAALGRLGLCTLAGVGLCIIFALFGATRNPLLVMFFYAYFLVHELRDETRLYQTYGDAPRSQPDAERFLDALSRVAALLFMCVLTLTYLLYMSAVEKRTPLTKMPQLAFVILVASLLGVTIWKGRQLSAQAKALYGDWPTVVRAHAPLFWVYAGLLATLVVGAFFGSTGFNLVILLHVTAWLVFVSYQLAKRPAASRTWNLWTWLRSTPAGFWVLHLGIAAVVLVLMAYRVYVWKRVGFVSELLASANFCYWGLMHISMAWWSK